MIEDSGRHLLSLINDVLDIAKIEAGRLELTVAPLEADELCRDSLRLVAQSAEEKSHTLDLELDPEVTILHGDELRLRQILVNLLSNAIKFTPQAGTIQLRVQGDAAGRQVHFSVEDNGVGIESEHLPMLFQPFTQLDSSLARRHAGTGLGLALVARFAEMHQGSVSVESTPDEGSRFTVTLPWNPTVGATNDLASPAMGEGHQDARGVVETKTTDAVKVPRTKLLLVEDNEATITALTEYLPLCHYSIEVAHNGHMALAALAKSRPDLIVMDIQMPEMDGLEAIAHVRSDPTFEHIPIIALTALAMPGDRERCLAAGANRYLRKPIRMEVLDRTIRELLRQTTTD
jgi:CheY-like chemotaxis protein